MHTGMKRYPLAMALTRMVDRESLRNRRLRLLRVSDRLLVRLLLLAASQGRLESKRFPFTSSPKSADVRFPDKRKQIPYQLRRQKNGACLRQ